MFIVEVPAPEGVYTKNNLNKLKNKKGIYKIFSSDYELLYVGKSKKIKNRVENQFKGKTHNKGLHHLFCYVEVIYVHTELEMEIYETFLINVLKPIMNLDKRYEDVEQELNSYKE